MNKGIVLEQVSKRFGTGHTAVQAVRDVSLEIPGDSMVVVAGPSGSGKSTLLGLIGGLEKPDGGRMHVAGMDLGAMSERQLSRYRRRQVGFIFQESNLLSDLTARENIELPLRLNHVAAHDRSRRVGELIERLDLQTRADGFPGQLSAGERQRVAVARAVVHRPVVLLADEPTANLDSARAKEVVSLIAQLHAEEEIPVVLATHDPRVIESIESRFFLRDGTVERSENL
jgi:putative ABC transport system ATP-binding protein